METLQKCARVRHGHLPNCGEDPTNQYLVRVVSSKDGSSLIYKLDATTLKAEIALRGAVREYQGGTLRVPDNFLVADDRDGTLMVREYINSDSAGFRLIREVRNRATGSWEEHPELGYLVKDRLEMTPIGFIDADPNKLYISTLTPDGGGNLIILNKK